MVTKFHRIISVSNEFKSDDKIGRKPGCMAGISSGSLVPKHHIGIRGYLAKEEISNKTGTKI